MILILGAGGAGIAHAALQRSPALTYAGSGSCVPPSKTTEQVTIHSDSQAVFFDLHEQITLKLADPAAHELFEQSSTGNYLMASLCYFQGLDTPPVFVSSGAGLAQFSNDLSTQNHAPSLLRASGWNASLHGGAIGLAFTAKDLCQSGADRFHPDWDGTQFTASVTASGSISALSPMPDNHSGKVYEWRFPRLNCKARPRLNISVRPSLIAYSAAEVVNANVFAGWGLSLISWSGAIAFLLLGVAVWVRSRRSINKAKYVFGLLAIAALGMAAANSYYGADPLPQVAVIFAISGTALAILLTGRLRIRLFAGIAAVVSAVAITMAFDSYHPNHDFPSGRMTDICIAAEVSALALIAASGVMAFRRLRSVVFDGDMSREIHGPLRGGLGLASLYGGTLLAIAFAYSMGNVETPISPISVVYSEIDVLRNAIAPFAYVLIAIALVVPIAELGPAAGRNATWGGLLGFAAVTQLPDPSFAYGTPPVAEVVFAAVLIRLTSPRVPLPDPSSPLSKLRTCFPRESASGNIVLAVEIAGILSLAPVAYFAYTAITSLLHNSPRSPSDVFFAAAGIVVQLAGWIIIGLVFSIVNTRLPGNCGPARAFIVSALWFSVGFVFYLLQAWLHASSGRFWIFFGLQLFLFLLIFSVMWDACILGKLSWSSFDKLREAYNLQQARSIVLYAIPLLLAIIALGQQVASGSGVEFVKSALNVVPAFLGR